MAPIERTCAFHAVSESLRWRAPAASSCEPEQARELRDTETNQRKGRTGRSRGYRVGRGSGEPGRVGDGGGGGGGVGELDRPAASEALSLLHRRRAYARGSTTWCSAAGVFAAVCVWARDGAEC